MKFSLKSAILLLILFSPRLMMAQGNNVSVNGSTYDPASVAAVPFLNITPDSRSGAMGQDDAGESAVWDLQEAWYGVGFVDRDGYRMRGHVMRKGGDRLVFPYPVCVRDNIPIVRKVV